jgi:hypothetical protein
MRMAAQKRSSFTEWEYVRKHEKMMKRETLLTITLKMMLK